MLNSLNWPALETRRKRQRLTLMYQVVRGLLAVPTDNLVASDQRTRAHHNLKFRTIYSNTTVHRHSYFPRTIPEWNALPGAVVDAPSLASFKERLARLD
jgi:hypothetical protein